MVLKRMPSILSISSLMTHMMEIYRKTPPLIRVRLSNELFKKSRRSWMIACFLEGLLQLLKPMRTIV